jgi:hypothetical protein
MRAFAARNSNMPSTFGNTATGRLTFFRATSKKLYFLLLFAGIPRWMPFSQKLMTPPTAALLFSKES